MFDTLFVVHAIFHKIAPSWPKKTPNLKYVALKSSQERPKIASLMFLVCCWKDAWVNMLETLLIT